MAILVTGGCGYIGSVTVEQLEGREVVVIDNLSQGHRGAIDKRVGLQRGNVADTHLIRKICDNFNITSCIHFAGSASVEESIKSPYEYFWNNVIATEYLLATLAECRVNNFIFSSSCTVYGKPKADIAWLTERHGTKPVNPYGWSKLLVEQLLKAYEGVYGMRFVSLRFFNVAGATELHGEDHNPETHLIPNIFKAVGEEGKKNPLQIYGMDYPTVDGTCARDYVHVSDIAKAHILALDYLNDGGKSQILNLGSECARSVLQCMSTVAKITKQPVNAEYTSRRPGDVPYLAADISKGKKVLGWKPQKSFDDIINDAWNWHQKHPEGYKDAN